MLAPALVDWPRTSYRRRWDCLSLDRV